MTATVLSDASARSCCSKAAVQLMNKQAGLEKKRHEMVDLELSGKHGKQPQSNVHLPWRYFESTCAVSTELELGPTRVQIGLL